VGRGDGLDDATRSTLLTGSYEDFVGQCVYGEDYASWKKKHHTKPSDEQMDKYTASKGLHAVHDKDKLKPVDPSEVCCTDVDACLVGGGESGIGEGGEGVGWRAVPMPEFKGTR
jgi:hypothetical protein